jgi:hypothetical protein
MITFTIPGQPQGKALQRVIDRMTVQGDCWIPALKPGRKGYVRCKVGGRATFVHRLAYEIAKGEIAGGMTIDHLCRNPSCFNPDHLEQVTVAENIRRGTQGLYQRLKTHCPHGHAYSPENTYVAPCGDRLCRTCQRANCRRVDKARGRRYAQ